MSEQLATVAELVERESGIQTNPSQFGALSAALGRIAPGMDAAAFLAAIGDAARRQVLLDCLIEEVVVQETFFMRAPRELEAIEWHRLLAAAHARGAQEVTVWVAACASGEEAYSVAMLAAEAFGGGPAPVSILATDVSDRALARAREGVYSERSTRDVGGERRERFFASLGRGSRVDEQLRSMVRFRRHNLVTGEAPPEGEAPFDAILCRNVLIYFGATTVEAVVASLESALRPGGQLILGASDRLTSSAQRLAEIATRPPAPAPPRRAAAERGWRTPRKPQEVAAPSASDALEASDPLDAEAHFARGTTELAEGDPGAAVGSFRRALYIDPTFGQAAFQLGRAHEMRGDEPAAQRAYAQALRALDGRLP
jgi:chemotaxis protein methyltransferase CheR